MIGAESESTNLDLVRSHAPSSALYRLVATPWFGRALIAAASLSLLLFGVLGVFRPGSSPFELRADTRVMYVAGKMWLEGHNPYLVNDFLAKSDAMFHVDHDFMASGFGYLPTAWPLCGLLGLFAPGPAFVFMLTVNLAAVAVTALYALRLSSIGLTDQSLRDSLRFFIPAVVIGSPFTAHVVAQGQSTMLATVLLVSGWYYTFVRPRWNLAGILFALATMKLQLALFVVAGLAIHRRWRVLVAMSLACALIVAFPVIVAGGPIPLVRDWLTEVHAYSAIPGNALGYPTVFGLQSLLVAAGLHLPGLGLLGVPLLVILWRYRYRFQTDELLPTLVASSCLLVYAHDYDLAALAPLHGCLWKRAGLGRNSGLAVAAFYGVLFLPQRAFRHILAPVFLHSREVALLAAVVWIVTGAVRRTATD
jgi:hypothetical protein